jgi:phosphatidate cytidylyltransferase
VTNPTARKSDLKVRAVSALVMIAVAGLAVWLGGYWLDAFILMVSAVTLFEFASLITKATATPWMRAIGILGAIGYVGLAASLLVRINSLPLLLLIIGSVVAVDVCAYFAGRTIGGPKIATSISPSKTWAGLGGGILGAWLALNFYFLLGSQGRSWSLFELLPFAVALAVIAQAGDFFESWLKRRAGVKDSSALIPGHGGFFDRVDGLLPVAIGVGLIVTQLYPHWLNP